MIYLNDNMIKSTLSGSFLDNEKLEDGLYTLKRMASNVSIEGVVRDCNLLNKGKIYFQDGSRFIGRFNLQNTTPIQGIFVYANGSIFQGHWKNNLYNGEGVLFEPDSQDHDLNEILEEVDTHELKEIDLENLENDLAWGIGKYTKCHWINGKPNGNGSIVTKNKFISGYWRLGKLFITTEKIKSSKKINPLILDFLNLEDHIHALKIRNKTFYSYYKRNLKLVQNIRLMQLILLDIHKEKSYERYFNNYEYLKDHSLLYLNTNQGIENLTELIISAKNNQRFYLPMVPFRSNAGCFNREYHYSNVFNPDRSKGYFSNFQVKKSKDIEIAARFDFEYLDPIRNTDEEEKRVTTLYEALKLNANKLDQIHEKFLFSLALPHLTHRRRHADENDVKHELNEEYGNEIPGDIVNLTSQQNTYYLEKLEYAYDYERAILDDSQKVLPRLKSQNEYFSLSSIYINNPVKPRQYVVFHNPVRSIALYISDREISHEERNHELLKSCNTSNLSASQVFDYLKEKEKIIRFKEKRNYQIIECDSQASTQGPRLVAFIRVSPDSQNHIELKKFHHIGKFVYLHLIDQTALEGFKITTCDIGTFLLFGDIIKSS